MKINIKLYLPVCFHVGLCLSVWISLSLSFLYSYPFLPTTTTLKILRDPIALTQPSIFQGNVPGIGYYLSSVICGAITKGATVLGGKYLWTRGRWRVTASFICPDFRQWRDETLMNNGYYKTDILRHLNWHQISWAVLNCVSWLTKR